MAETIKRNLAHLFQVLVTILIIFIVIDINLLVILTFSDLKLSTVNHLINCDLAVSFFIFLIFIGTLFTRREHKKYLKENWIILIASIPLDFIFLGLFHLYGLILVLGIVRAIKIVALVVTLKKIGSWFFEFCQKTGLGYGIIILTVVFLMGSVLFFDHENGINPAVTSFEDSLWYMVASMTTTGYGDIVPITIVGRIIGAIAMITGLIFTGYATASIASALIKKFREERDKDREMAQVLVETLRKERKKDKEDIKNLLNDIIEKMDKDKK